MSDIAILHVPHEQCEASMAEMLKSISYDVYGLGRDISHLLNRHMVPISASRLPLKAEIPHFHKCSLFVTVKHYNLPGLYENYDHLNGKILWMDINGGIPGVHIPKDPRKSYPFEVPVPYVSANKHYADNSPYKVSGPRYICYIPLARREEFLRAAHHRTLTAPPVCLVNNPKTWGYGWMVKPLKDQYNTRFFGSHGAADGLVKPSQISSILTTALCMVHMKGRDCPGIALYESLLTGCPVIITDLFLRRTLYTDLYEHEHTCLVAKDDPELPIPERTNYVMKQVSEYIDRLKDPKENARIGSNGRKRLNQLMWRSDRDENVASFKEFMERHFR